MRSAGLPLDDAAFWLAMSAVSRRADRLGGGRADEIARCVISNLMEGMHRRRLNPDERHYSTLLRHSASVDLGTQLLGWMRQRGVPVTLRSYAAILRSVRLRGAELVPVVRGLLSHAKQWNVPLDGYLVHFLTPAGALGLQALLKVKRLLPRDAPPGAASMFIAGCAAAVDYAHSQGNAEEVSAAVRAAEDEFQKLSDGGSMDERWVIALLKVYGAAGEIEKGRALFESA
eukprot:Hpha_TRINITY_DN34570_c0_g1::TRINITY_DN34570_c0_g1_i1::g.96444::m.96444